MRFNTKNKIIVAGHRGDPAHAAENTLKSFKSAIDLGADMIETDIHSTKDGHLVLMHDADVSRTTDGSGLIADMTLGEIKKLHAGKERLPVPTLRELFELCAPVDGFLSDLEIKVYSHAEGVDAVAYAVDKTVEMCEEYNMCDRVILNSFDAYVLEYIFKKYGKRFKLHGFYPYDIMKNVNTDPSEYLDYACYFAAGEEGKQQCQFLKSHGIEPCTAADTTESAFYEVVEYGCSMFTENDPETVMKWRNLL